MEPFHFGASIRGPLHTQQKRPNEDAWLGCAGSFGRLIVVCDGLGSRRQAHRGSQMGCMAVREAVRLWSKTEEAPIQSLLWLIEVVWRIRVAPSLPEECATTCLFALRQPSRRWIIGGLGDGLGLIKQGPHTAVPVTGRHTDNFANQTDGLGCPHSINDWVVETISPSNEETTVVLCTDGIADDLVEERFDDFATWLMGTFADLPPSKRWHALSREIRHWPTPGHQDDKTLAILSQPTLSE